MLNAVGVVCLNIEKSIKFYNLLGVSFTKFGEGHYEGKTDGGLRLMLDSVELMKKVNPNWKLSSGNGVVLCFKQKDSDAVDFLFSKAISEGFSAIKEPWDAFWGQRYSSIEDPDGNQIDIYADLK